MKDYSKFNLDVKHYRNGNAIPQVQDNDEWSKLTTGAWCYYDNDESKGVLYNWYAVNDNRGLAPEGWRIPTDDEMNDMLFTNDELGGFRNLNGSYDYFGGNGVWWSSTETNSVAAWYRLLYYNYSFVTHSYTNKQVGFSVRCIKEQIKTK
jgi:hypothetical protein